MSAGGAIRTDFSDAYAMGHLVPGGHLLDYLMMEGLFGSCSEACWMHLLS